jgi:hypothetical protein
MALKAAKDKGEKTFVVAGKTYQVKEGYLEIDFKDKSTAEKAYNYINNEIWAGGNPPYDDFNQEGNSLQIDHSGKSKELLKDLKDLPRNMKFKVASDEAVEESFAVAEDVPAMEVGTDRYREYASNLTPGETDPEWVRARNFKVASMKEALAKVWGLDEKKLDKSSKEAYDEEDEELKPVKGSKTMTGGKIAKVDLKPKT